METQVPRFEEVVGERLKDAIIDPSHVMALVRLPEEVLERLEGLLGKTEISVRSRSEATRGTTELATMLKLRHGYTLDEEMVGSALYHLSRGLGTGGNHVTAYYWPEVSPIVFRLDGEVCLVVAPKIE
jgi:hypothetical protein